MGPVDIRSFWKPAAKPVTKLNESEPIAREGNKENACTINGEKVSLLQLDILLAAVAQTRTHESNAASILTSRIYIY